MKIKFLGTSYGAPSVGRHQQSILVEAGERGYLFDVGAPVLDLLLNDGYDLKKIRAIFITHMHGDHINGLFDILNLASYFNMRFDLYLPDANGMELVKQYCQLQHVFLTDERIKLKQITEGIFFHDNGVTVTGVPTAHMEKKNRSCFGFLVQTETVSCYITGDLHGSLKDFPEFLYATPTDMIITECAHFLAENLIEKIGMCNTDKVAVIHVMPQSKYDDLKRIVDGQRICFYFPNDGDEYTI
ncbi:MAG: MBL fold metallo-hydrolase [Clostridia bacterium]|nr:MBL fold metallo-hydrolase [Clostridia bacterium]